MDMRKLRRFFIKEVGIDDILTEIEPEVDAYGKALAKRGASAPVHGTNGQFTYVVKNYDIQRLCELYLQGKVSELHINYLANLIELSESFKLENDAVREALFELSSPELNGPVNEKSVREIIRNLN